MFKDLKRQVRANFDKMSENNVVLFYTQISKDKMWDNYLESFKSPQEKQEHNCNNCKSFLRQYSGIVAIEDNKRISLWDDINAPAEFKESVDAMREYIHSLPITDIFLTDDKHCGTDQNRNGLDTITWEHFYFMSPLRFVDTNTIDRTRGKFRTARKQFERALKELKLEAVDTVIELIAQGSLYRGNTYSNMLTQFRSALVDYNSIVGENAQVTEDDRTNHTWTTVTDVHESTISIRNTSIGTLLVNLSEGMDLDMAVTKFEVVVAPTNYKRPSALVTPKMIDNAKAKLTDLGLLDSLERRYATPVDLSAEDFLFVDRSSELTDVFDDMSKDSKKRINVKSLKKVEEITIEKFIKDVLPTTKSVELLLQNNHLPKMVSLITGENKDAKSLFQWDNLFSWSYTGGITDSIKERVKAAGGQVTGELRISLSWFNFDDLDLHVVCPDGFKIYYPRTNKRHTRSGGNLDVDMNAGSGTTRQGVENIIFPIKENMLEGIYEVRVNQFVRRELVDEGYDIQIEHDGNITDVHYDKSPRNTDIVVNINYSKSEGITFDKDLDSKVSTKKKWGVETNSFIQVKHLLLSPNYWGENKTGNKHYMFMLDNCLNDEVARPFFNEFLKSEFNENRKVFEVMGGKMKVEPSQDQLSGVGFSETIASEVILRVEGKFKRLLKIKF
jgi:hypothetical protein